MVGCFVVEDVVAVCVLFGTKDFNYFSDERSSSSRRTRRIFFWWFSEFPRSKKPILETPIGGRFRRQMPFFFFSNGLQFQARVARILIPFRWQK